MRLKAIRRTAVRSAFRSGVVLGLGALSLSACDAAAPPDPIIFQVVRTLPHDTTAYTQGLLFHEGLLYESTGRYGESTVRTVDPADGTVGRAVPLDSAYFGEGLARVGDRLIQLTWKEGTARVLDLATLDSIGAFTYGGEGWGLCYDGTGLWMSDGTSRLTRRDAETFAVQQTLDVTVDGVGVYSLNELECVEGAVWANVYQRNEIVRVDPATGAVTGVLDASGLTRDAGRAGDLEAVLNGIAWNPRTRTFFVTGKWWSTMYEIAIDGM
ncbi:MAG: glutaminyl-peptide cyclotransferase [Gemmatimonadetes bacterium]|nr:glutaminyl-peptide cyclotransferase [Gemmatimonadota bacterium]